MSDPRDIDEDAILKGLSPEELDKLEYELQEMDPEVWRSAWFGFKTKCLSADQLLQRSKALMIISGASGPAGVCYPR